MNRVAVFPGSFDPVTIGHYDLVARAVPLFDKIIVALGVNSEKKSLFTQEQRLIQLQQAFASFDKVVVDSYSGLTVDYCKKSGANYIIRGLRSNVDFEYEKNIAQMNKSMIDRIETIFLACSPAYAAINSSIVREIYKNKGNIEQFLPVGVSII